MFGFDKAPWSKDYRQELKEKLPPMKPLSLQTGAFVFGGVAITGMMIGATISTYIFVGAVTLAGLVAVIESNPYVKYFVINSNRSIDLALLAATIVATAMLGPTIAISLTFTGLGYSLVVAPYYRKNNNLNQVSHEK